ncbi:MAG: NTPase, partial [Ruminococcaceae bacterium]|nr:NTPase [Oscillospiraceae bacterium]
MRGEIMFNTDKPIERIEEDLLNRATFSQELANAILAYTDTENFAISLCGEWGCGKTSILRMVVQEINKKAQDMSEDERPIIINFNPWNYSDKNQLITQFFKEVFIVLKKESNNEKLKRAGDALQKYSSIFDYAKYIPKVGEYIALLKSLIEGLGKQMSDVSDDMDSIENQKNLVI